MIDTDTVIERVVRTTMEIRPDWSETRARETVNLLRESISINPQLFLDSFLEGVERLKAERDSKCD